MAAPNLLNPKAIKGENLDTPLTDTSATVVCNNPAGSGKVLKVISVRATNVDGTNNCDVTLARCDEDDGGGTASPIGSTITVPAGAALDLVTEDAPKYLKEDQSLVATASAGNDLVINVDWLEIE